ncbi:hypothetical protein JCM5353_005243 [Sporobolomyces roseus]
MFTTFSQGSDDPSNWNDQPSYRPGRFHAHALPTNSTSRVGGGGEELVPSGGGRERLREAVKLGEGAKRFFRRKKGKGKEKRFESDEGERERLLSEEEEPEFHARLRVQVPVVPRRRLVENVIREEEGEDEEEDDAGEISWLLLRPGKKRVRRWMASWWKRWALLVGLPCVIVWFWCSIPFPVTDPYQEEPPWHIPWPPSNEPPGTFETLLRKLPWMEPSPRVPSLSTFTIDDSSSEPEGIQFQIANNEYSDQTFASTTNNESSKISEVPQGTPDDENLPVDANFYFFLVVYYGAYLAVALVFVTKLFDLYRLNWWPSSLGGAFWYTLFWTISLSIGFLLHKFDLDGFGRRSHSRHGDHETDPRNPDSWDWERKTTWILLAFATMSMPALACFTKLRADRRNSWRRSLTPAQKTFLERQLTQRMPRSYRRFLWFLTAIALSLLTLIMGQGFATIYLSTLPHSNIEGLVYVWCLILSCNLLNNVSNWILHRKVRSQSLVFIFRLLFQLTYHVFYRNLFARLRSPDQAAYITLLSSSFVVLWYPLSMSKTFHRLLSWTVGTSMEWEEYSHSVATMFYLRNLSENVTMVAFLGWVTILHWGPNKLIYPFFSFADPSDPYTYRLTISASLVIWLAELFSSFLARLVCWLAYGIDVTNVGLDQFREHPELVVACIWASTHVLMDILLFLVKLNFR